MHPMSSRTRLLSPLLLAALTTAGVACSGSSERSGFEGEGTTSPGTDGGAPPKAPPGGFGGGGSDGGAPAEDGCSDAAKLVYVVSAEFDLYSFDPKALAFTKIGRLDCPAGSATPNSMAVDRDGNAWVNYSDGGLFKVSTVDASCQATGFQKLQSGFQRFGMAFSANAAGAKDETLFVVGIDGVDQGKGLAKIDLGTMKLATIGDFSGTLQGKGAELTGTGAGDLFGFFTTQPNATLAKIDKASGATSDDKTLTGVNTGSAWAFSFWGGDFWFYTAGSLDLSSKVTRYKKSGDGSISVVKQNVGGFRIVGAGVSTCAPLAPPS